MAILRSVRSADADQIVALGLRAWEPVFASMREAVGSPLFRRLFTDDWRRYQETDIRRAVSEYLVTVAEEENQVMGYVAIDLPADEIHGEIYMLAVDPSFQGRGIGSRLTDHAIEEIRKAGRAMVMVETGGDPGHAPARATYERRGFIGLPAERYFLLV
jgi:ribosomal protein S18 acetylase RimI-like enzyme